MTNTATYLPRDRPLPAARAYDLVADYYDSWHWSAYWNAHEAPLVRKWLDSLDGILLDVGCGTGRYRSAVQTRHLAYVGVDSSAAMLERNRRRKQVAGGTAEYIQGDVSTIAIPDETFDAVLCTRVLSHVADLGPALRKIATLLRPGGECLITDIHPRHDYVHTRIPAGTRVVTVETYKHQRPQLMSAVSAAGRLDVMEYAEHAPTSSTPTFYSLRLTKRTCGRSKARAKTIERAFDVA